METTFDTEYTQDFTLEPSNTYISDIVNSVGYAVNGVNIYNPFTGIDTIAAEDETLDTCVGHPADGQYHYHGYAPCLAAALGDTEDASSHSSILGWAYDGFPIYGPFGYSDATDSTSAIIRLQGGYEFTGVDTTEPDDWEFVDGYGDLDECNGRFGKTPEFPSGMYHYVLNVDADLNIEFPGTPYCVGSSSTSTSTACAPTPAPTSCVNDPSWYKDDTLWKDCDWVSSKPSQRCSKMSNAANGFISADEGCPVACNSCFSPTTSPTMQPTTCADSTSWYKSGRTAKNCEWVSKRSTKRCGYHAKQNCKVACGTC